MYLQRWNFSAKGKLGQIQVPVNSNFNIDINEGEVKVLPINESKNDQIGVQQGL